MDGLALVAVVFCSMPRSMPFGFFRFPFFFGDFGAELGVFFVFDGAAGFFAFVACFEFFFHFRGRGGEVGGQGRDAQRMR